MNTAEPTEVPDHSPVLRPPAPPPRSAFRRYAAAIAAAISALAAVQLMELWHAGVGARSLYFVAVMVSASYGGLGPGLLATGLAALASAYLNLGTPFQFDLTFGEALQLAVFVIVAAVISSQNARQRRTEERLRSTLNELARALEQETLLARTDALTGLPNARSIDERIERIEDIVPAGGYAIGVVDLDHFKLVNDYYGHAVGDDVLVRVGTAIRTCLRSSDVVARLGGDEFLLLFGSLSVETAERIGRRIVDAVGTISAAYPSAHLSASVGITFASEENDVRSLIDRADQAMYEAKRLGKGGVTVHHHQPPDSEERLGP